MRRNVPKEKSIRGIARVGYLSKAVVYTIVGVLAAAAALNFSFGEVGGASDALQTIESSSYGSILLGITGFGLVGYIVWKFVQVVWDPEHHDDSAGKEFVRRAFYAVSGAAYTSVALSAILTAFGSGSSGSGGGSGIEQAVSWVAGVDYGRYLIMAGGAVIVGFGVYQAYKGYADAYLDNLKELSMPGWLRRSIEYIGTIGHFGRATVFGVTGGLVVWAGYTYNPSAAGGTENSLRWLTHQPWGQWLLLAVGVAFACYGLFVATKARYRQFDLA